MHSQQVKGRDYSSSLFGTGEATSGCCIQLEALRTRRESSVGLLQMWGGGQGIRWEAGQAELAQLDPTASPPAQSGPRDAGVTLCSEGHNESPRGTGTSWQEILAAPKETVSRASLG